MSVIASAHMRTVWFVAVLAGAGACSFNPESDDTDAAATDDADHDGVRDDDDNCRDVVNPDQHDEDADGVGDVCDNCPHVANADQANVGETGAGGVIDGAGDACDPFPTVGGNDIVLFESFARPLEGWSQTGGGMWSTADDALTQSRDQVTTVLYVGAPMAGTVVDVTATLTSGRGDLAGGFGFGPVALFTPSITHGVGYACDLLDRDTQPFDAALDYLDSAQFVTLDSANGTETSLVGLKVAMRVMARVTAGSPQTCNITGAGLDLAASASDDRQDHGRVALRTFNAAVRFDHMVVFSVAP